MNEIGKPVGLDALREVLRRLRAEGGCPWDRKQTHQTIRRYLFEEAAEVADAIDSGDPAQLCDELGDLLFQVVFHSGLAEEKGQFTLEDVARACVQKMVRRHPHVFGQERIDTVDGVWARWDEIKRAEKPSRADEGMLGGVPRSLSALPRAQKLQHKAAAEGFDWPRVSGVCEKVREELGEFETALATGGDIEEEVGDLLFSGVNLGRFAGLDCEAALARANAKFERRLRGLEERVKASGRRVKDLGIEELEEVWQQVKRQETAGSSRRGRGEENQS